MATTDDILRRWQANAASAGVPLSDGDIERIESGGMLARVVAIEAMLARIGADEVAPDYLHVLSAQTGGGENA